ncbi:hypothetical protein ACFL0H_10080 [Thermodesulfobacteriota bacterium]
MRKHRTSLKGIKSIIVLAGLAMFLAAVTTSSIPCFAEHRLVKPEWVMPANYPEWFHGWGRIGYIGKDELVINDIPHRLSIDAEFHTPERLNVSKNLFVPGKMVGFLFNDDYDIVSVWLITMD